MKQLSLRPDLIFIFGKAATKRLLKRTLQPDRHNSQGETMTRCFNSKFFLILTLLLAGCFFPVMAQDKTDGPPPIKLDPTRLLLEDQDLLMVAQRDAQGKIFQTPLTDIAWPDFKKGHARFLSQDWLNRNDARTLERTRRIFAKGHPARFLIVQCSDERVTSADELYDMPAGTHFPIRTAGNNILGQGDARASFDFAIQKLDIRGINLMGQYRCGALTLATKTIPQGVINRSSAIVQMMERFIGVVGACLDKADPIRAAVETNIIWQFTELAFNEALLPAHILKRAGFMLIGSAYNPETGEIHYLQEMSGKTILDTRKKFPDLVHNRQTVPASTEEITFKSLARSVLLNRKSIPEEVSQARSILQDSNSWPEEFLEHGGRKWLEATSSKAKPKTLKAGHKKEKSRDLPIGGHNEADQADHGHRDH